MGSINGIELTWTTEGTPAELHPLLRALGEEYPISEDAARHGLAVTFHHDPSRQGFSIERRAGTAVIRYGRLSHAGRALGTLLAGLVGEGATVADGPAFSTLGVLLDCGHNATVTSEHLRKWLRRLALLGFDTAMVYTEAGYSLPDESCFGYLRGAYTREELRDLDAYAAGLGIELVGAIQALGHLEQMLKWAPYAGVRDTEHTLLVGEPRTYELVEKMVVHWASVFRSRRLHLGMDETYDLGRGRSLDLHGYRRGLDLYVEHLGRVAEICRAHGVRPMIWSDVLFRLAGTSGAHYDRESRIPDAVRRALPADVDLAYWDYYSDSPEHYEERIQKHRELGYEPVMASAVWSWPTPWHDWARTERNAGACIQACRSAGLKEMIFALWSDDGGFWDVDSNLAGLAYAAEKCFGDGSVDEEALARRFRAICGADLAVHRVAARINEPLQACSLLWDDPMLAIYLRHAAREGTEALREAAAHYEAVARDLEPHREDRAAGDLGHAWRVARLFAAKTRLAARLLDAWAAGDRDALAAAREDAPGVAALVEELARSYRGLWLARHQPFGLEVIQIRLAGQAERYRELARRIGEYLEGEVPTIPEFDEWRKGAYLPVRSLSYRALATGSRVF